MTRSRAGKGRLAGVLAIKGGDMTPAIKLDSPIVMQHPDNPGNWILVQDYRYLDKGIQRCIPRGFVTDFASIPRLFWNIMSPTELGDVGPICHDWEYRNSINTRAVADKRFLNNMKLDGISWWKRSTAYSMVRAFGWSSWNSGKVTIEELEPA
jgi:hypothetical protein